MADIIDDDLVGTLVTVCQPADVQTTLRARYGPLVDRIILLPDDASPPGSA